MSTLRNALKANSLPTRLPFFYGWIMLPIATLAMIGTSPGQTFIVSVFNNAFRETLNISHSQLTGAYMLGTLTAAMPQSFFGSLMDKYGIRRVMSGVVLMFGLACVFASRVNSLWMLFFAFVGLRMFGQGALGLLASNTMAMWFDRQLGKVASIMNMGMALATAVLPPAVLWLIGVAGWRWSYVILGMAVWALLFPLLAFLFQNQPEDIGQMKDSKVVVLETAVSSTVTPTNEISFSLPEALKTRAFWLIAFPMVMWAMIGTAVIFNIVPLFEENGYTDKQATLIFSTFSAASIVFQLIGGYLADKYPLQRLGGIGYLGFTIAIGCLIFLSHSIWIGQLYALIYGAGQGITGAVNNTVWVRYYGRKNLGKIRGAIATATVAGSSLGPFIMGFTFDQFHTYQFSLILFTALFAIGTVAFFFAEKPIKPQIT